MDYLILALATWRLASLLASEDGPFAVFERIRQAVGVAYDDYGNPVSKNEPAKAIVCIWCISIWLAVALAFLYWLASSLAIWCALPFALSVGAILIDEIIDGLRK
jgi:hypothetical protein